VHEELLFVKSSSILHVFKLGQQLHKFETISTKLYLFKFLTQNLFGKRGDSMKISRLVHAFCFQDNLTNVPMGNIHSVSANDYELAKHGCVELKLFLADNVEVHPPGRQNKLR
jgi:hypothetical protein